MERTTNTPVARRVASITCAYREGAIEVRLNEWRSQFPHVPRDRQANTPAKRRSRLRYIHPMTREQQTALIEEACAARLAAREAQEHKMSEDYH